MSEIKTLIAINKNKQIHSKEVPKEKKTMSLENLLIELNIY